LNTGLHVLQEHVCKKIFTESKRNYKYSKCPSVGKVYKLFDFTRGNRYYQKLNKKRDSSSFTNKGR